MKTSSIPDTQKRRPDSGPADPCDTPDMRALLDALAKDSEESLWRDIEAFLGKLEAGGKESTPRKTRKGHTRRTAH